ncbi:hypothetical protein Fmac_018402 [Flemingia macrophylla]|uniref:Uncharacterized protein n=1 Tax=Flemingia macrophylla TaxID=520843 RepID=A0ABD1M4X5_9FABA
MSSTWPPRPASSTRLVCNCPLTFSGSNYTVSATPFGVVAVAVAPAITAIDVAAAARLNQRLLLHIACIEGPCPNARCSFYLLFNSGIKWEFDHCTGKIGLKRGIAGWNIRPTQAERPYRFDNVYPTDNVEILGYVMAMNIWSESPHARL